MILTQKEYGIKAMYDRKMIIKAIKEMSWMKAVEIEGVIVAEDQDFAC